jgi:cytoskeletal protein CcmA (bactofilin family)
MLAERQSVAMCSSLADMPDLAPAYPVPAVIADTRHVFVDQGLTLRGEFNGCENLAVAGHVESDVVMHRIDIHEAGSFKGDAKVGEARIAGRYEGMLTVAETLVVAASAHITGAVQCGRLQLEDGGKIEGELRVLAEEAKAAEEAQDTEAAGDESAAVAVSEPATVDTMFSAATAVENNAALAEAEATFRAALKTNLCDVAALSGLGHIARQRGDLIGALHYFELIMASDTTNVSVRCVSIDILRALSRHDEAAAMETALLSIRAQSNTTADEPKAPAKSLVFDEAEAMFKSVLDRHPRNLGALAGLGHLARRRGDHAAMREHYMAALAVEPMNLTLRVDIARAFKEEGEVALARQILETVLNEDWASGISRP